MKIPQFFSRILFHKTIAATLVMMILVSQTIHVDFFDRVEAGPENYRDIVSIIVDRETYQQQRTTIKRYAEDIAGYLGGIRTSILVVDPNTPVGTIATKNEKLYYEGDGEKGTSSLVGTILIGNIPIPQVTKEGQGFSSLYPYVDFDDKVFVYDSTSTQYRYNSQDPKVEQVDIWHGVINPAVGRGWAGAPDIAKIGQFLDKTHEFYTKSGKFAPSNIPPKVFYYDGFAESKSINARSLFQYSLSIKNAENIAYSRFTKYLLKDVSNALREFDSQNEDPDMVATYASLGLPTGSDTVSDDQAKKLPDIQTRDITLSFLKNFKGIFNEKSLGEELLSVHNAGRYTSGATVRADLVPISITLMDDIAQSTLRESNRALEKQIDTVILDGKYARRIPIFDEVVTSSGAPIDRTSPTTTIAENYMFGEKSINITDPLQCTIARGSTGNLTQFGRSQLVEANTAFDILKTQSQVEQLKIDTELLVNMRQPNCFPDSKPRLDSYWGGNSILRIAGGSGDPTAVLDTFPVATTFSGFTAPIFSLGGMKESNRLEIGGVANCLTGRYQYTMSPARVMNYTETVSVGYGDATSSVTQSCTTAYPSEWTRPGGTCTTFPSVNLGGQSAPRYTCISNVASAPVTIDFASSATEFANYTASSCNNGVLMLDGQEIARSNRTCITTLTSGVGDDMTSTIVDNTQYKNLSFHTIPSLYHHTSPTDEEIAAATANRMTPSLPVDMVRYVEFVTPKGNIARIHYPNFFSIEADDIATARSWVRDQSNREWQAIIDLEQATILSEKETRANAYLAAGILPTSPIDWNRYISDDMLTRIIQSKNWLNPDIATKYKQAIEAILSYSHGASGSLSPSTLPPQIPSLSEEYEVAYLGLPASFGADFSQAGYSRSMDDYRTHMREIEGANISDENIRDGISEANNPATECGPPDGVPLAQWPGAIMCWIKAQFPPRILAGSCGPSTIGLASPSSRPLLSPGQSIVTDTGALTQFYSGSQLIPHLPRSSIGLRDSIVVDLHLLKDNIPLGTLPNTEAHLEIVSGTTGGKSISTTELSKYLTLAPSSVIVGEKGAKFLIASHGTAARLSLRGYYILPLPDGSEIRVNSAVFQIQVTPEYYSLGLEQSGSTITSIDVTSADSVVLRIDHILRDGTSMRYQEPIAMDIFDDIDGRLVYSGSSFRPGIDHLPISMTKRVGVYRIHTHDSRGISGEMTLAVRSGILTQIRVTPISSALVRGSETLAMVRLLDRLGNQTTPDLHSLRLDVTGGYIRGSDGDKRTSMTMDVMESQVPIVIGADTAGTLHITATIDGTIVSNQDITIYDSAQIVLKRDRDPRVGDPSIGAHIEIWDASGKKIPGLSSVVSWSLPLGAGSFSKEAITITDGRSEDFSYIPGTVSGDHSLSLDIPGIGSVSDIRFSLLPGDPLSITHIREGESIVFSLRDRYNNIATASLTGTLQYNSNTPGLITFTRGTYTIPLVEGYYMVDVPGLRDFAISYSDATGAHRIPGIDRYTAYIGGPHEQLDFARDYNARYTVLAGDSYLREGEDILYNTTPGLSQSLAVSTLLDTPYRRDVLLSLLPGGSYHLGQSAGDTVLESAISLSNGFPLLTVSDLVSHQQVARVIYPMQGASLESCHQSTLQSCDNLANIPTIRLVTPPQSILTGSIDNGILTLSYPTMSPLLSVTRDGTLTLASGVSLSVRDTNNNGLEMGVMQGGQEIATLIYMMDRSRSVNRSTQFTQATPRNTPTLLSTGFALETTRPDPLATTSIGYQIVRTSDSRELDEVKNGPSHTDSLGALSEVSGVGWTGNNTMLLAYAGGDTVGESTGFFHTYTLVNMGDPVAHIDHGRAGTERDGIDRSIGSIIARGTRSGIADYAHRDMDADGIEDLIIIYQDGYIELLLNRGGKFRSRGMIAYNRDIDSKQIYFADVTHDGYSDIIGLDKNGSLILIDNTIRKLTRRDITLEAGAQIPSHISQLRIHDMDADQRDDIIYITAGGELGILYGSSAAGTFTKKILDPTLGITLSPVPTALGGAIYTTTTLPIRPPLSVTASVGTGPDEGVLQGEVYYTYSEPMVPLATTPNIGIDTLSVALDDIASRAQIATTDGTSGNKESIYIRSQYASAYGLDISKVYTNTTHPTLYTGDSITATVRIKNTTNRTMGGAEYLDTIPKIFSVENTQKYSISRGDKSIARDYESIGDNEYDAHFVLGDIAAGDTIVLSYDMIALPASYGEMIVGDLERGTVGADIYGDVGFKTSTTCGATMLLWTSSPTAREYARGTHEFGSVSLPDGLASRLTDGDKNGTPDSIENMSLANRQQAFTDMTTAYGGANQSIVKSSKNGDQINIGFDSSSADGIVNATQNLMDGLACGFGGGGCMNFPLNWAPMAPGNPISILGNTLPGTAGWASPEGSPTSIPIFSALTWVTMPITIGACGYIPLWGSLAIPSVWPVSPFGMPGNASDGGDGFPVKYPQSTCGSPIFSTGKMQAGGQLGTKGNTNFLRIFVTPTLTLGMGSAICMGGPASSIGNTPSKGLSPLVQGGNCVVMTKPMNVCKGDGSSGDGDVSAISGLGTVGGDSWNASSCRPQADTTTEVENQALTRDIVSYLRNPNPNGLTGIYSGLSRRGPRSTTVGPLLSVGSASSGGPEINIEVDPNTRISDIGSVIKVKNKRIAAFPDFVMDWLTRQTEELTTSLFTPPNLTIIPPTSFGQNAQVDSSFADFSKNLGEKFSSANMANIKQGSSAVFASKGGGVPGTLNAIKSAYTLIGKLPFVSIKQVNIPLNIPWFDKKELDKYQRSLDGYKKEIDTTLKNFCINDPSPACLDKKAKFQNGAFVSSISQNLKRIEEYKKFPLKIQKYITWKERYIAQILCNITSIQQITGGWLRDNGVRFRKWAELYVLIKAIAQSWQPMLDIFADTNKSCGVCRNERNNLQYWKFKLISSLIPSLPVLRFPKWPDIILDLSDIRLGINISMPNFVPRLSPIRFPSLPSLSAGSLSASVSLPGLPILPGLPPLPDLPDLPSLPKIKLPDLPPPPKIPKIAGSISAFLGIMKLISKMYCFYQKTVLIPEWQVGDVIAQRTERQGTSPFDFINLSLPQFSLPSIREIRVGSHVNSELRSDFISEFARSSVQPINEFQTDLQGAIPSSIGTSVTTPSVNVDVRPGAYLDQKGTETLPDRVTKMIADLDREKNIFLEIGEFVTYLTRELDTPELAQASTDLERGLRVARVEADQIEGELTAYNNKRFDILRDYLSAESDSNAHLQNIVDLISSDTVGEPRQLIADISDTSSRATRLLASYDELQGAPSETPPSGLDRGLTASRTALTNRLSRMVAEISPTSTTSPSSSMGVASGYSPNYQGIYIRTPSGVQTRLFDYIAPVTQDTRVDTVDIDQDGDLDYIYLLDGALYVKYNWTKVPNKIIDTSTKISSITPDDLAPYVPDYFYEDVSTPHNLNYSFVSSSQTENEWRVEFYDQYIEWDKLDTGAHNPRVSPKTTIDMFSDIESVPLASHSGILTHRVSRSLRSVADTQSFLLEGRSIDIYTGALSLSLSPGRVLYTGDRSVTLSYSNQTTPTIRTISLAPHTGYEFSSPTEITTEGGQLYIIGAESRSRYTYSDELVGLPLLPGMRLYASDAGSVVRDLTGRQDITLLGGSTYITYDLGQRADHYNINLPYADGYYYARLQNLTDKKLDRAGVTLLAPQAASDDGDPIIDLPTEIRLPIYTSRSYLLKDILTDLSAAILTVDNDITTDMNNNAIFDDDFVSMSPTANISPREITFGVFTQPGKYNMVLRAVDALGNTTTMPLIVTTYTPIPRIETVTATGWVMGTISESLSGIPTHLFRVRSGEQPILLSSGATLSSSLGRFATGSLFISPEIISLGKGPKIGTTTTKGDIRLGSGYNTEIVPASPTDPMRILIVDASGSISHTHTLTLPEDTRFIDTSRTAATVTGVLLIPTAGVTRIIPASPIDPSIPGGQYITDMSYRPLAALARDGNIYTLDPLVTLRYRSRNGYMSIEIIRQGIVVATVEYRIDFFYTMR